MGSVSSQLSAMMWNITNRLRLIDVIDIALLAFLIYTLMTHTKQTRVSQIIKGVVVMLAAWWLSDVLGMRTIHAAGKESLAISWREAHPDARVLFIGDTTHDAHVAAVMGADCLLFEGGHMSRRRLAACGCPIIAGFDELIGYTDGERV